MIPSLISSIKLKNIVINLLFEELFFLGGPNRKIIETLEKRCKKSIHFHSLGFVSISAPDMFLRIRTGTNKTYSYILRTKIGSF